MKVCAKCKVSKRSNFFFKNKRNEDNLYYICKECYHKKDRTKYYSEYFKLNREVKTFNQRKIQREYLRKIRENVINTLGRKCIVCGFNDYRALQIDHIDGGGSKERKHLNITNSTYYKLVVESFYKGENKYQLLCANCNWIKRTENKECFRYL